MSIAGPQTIEAALSAYQAIVCEDFRRVLGMQRPLCSADIDELRAEKALLAALLDVTCDAEGWHVADWCVVDGKVICPDCQPGTGRIAGGWSDIASVLTGMPLFQEVIRRATGKEG